MYFVDKIQAQANELGSAFRNSDIIRDKMDELQYYDNTTPTGSLQTYNYKL